MSPALEHPARVLGRVHGGEVEHGDVRLAVVVHRELHVHHLVLGRELGGLAGVQHQRVPVHVLLRQQLSRVRVVLAMTMKDFSSITFPLVARRILFNSL